MSSAIFYDCNCVVIVVFLSGLCVCVCNWCMCNWCMFVFVFDRTLRVIADLKQTPF